MLPEDFRAVLNVTRSFSGRRWRFREANADAVRALQRTADISPALAHLLCARNIAAEDVESYLNPTLKRLLPEPFVLAHMEQAVTRAAHAVVHGETIAVFGDYDVDGSCSAALLHDFLAAIGRSPLLYVPDRLREGYGPNAPALLGLKEKGASLVITVDCGAGAPDALAAALAAGLDVIVLDHHAVDPGTAAVPALPGIHVNPNQPGDQSGLGYLCAAGVTFLFLVAINRELRNSGWYLRHGIAEPDLRRSLDLVGLATVCDVVPLTGVNRAFVRAGVARLSRQERPGIGALAAIARAEPPFSFYECGFVFGPRINAGGRVGRCSLGVELLTARTENDAARLAGLLDLHNRERQALETAIVREAIAAAEQQPDRAFVLVSGAGWHPGVVGLVASRLKDRFHKPVLAIGFDGENGRGSARSVPGIDLGAIVRAARDGGLLDAGGGHAMAAGFSLGLARLEEFRDWLASQFEGLADGDQSSSDIWLDALVSPSGATPELAADIDRAGPFGAGNAEPVLVASDVRVGFADIVGQGHVRLRLRGGDGSGMSGIAFRAADTTLGRALLAARGERIHAAGFLRARRWNGRVEAQLQLEDAAAVA
jgi:single-stranded-DNA-specific exonuclease